MFAFFSISSSLVAMFSYSLISIIFNKYDLMFPTYCYKIYPLWKYHHMTNVQAISLSTLISDTFNVNMFKAVAEKPGDPSTRFL